MSVTLKELQETINEQGSIELFVNGKQQMLREHPAIKSYNALIKNYNSTIKQLLELMPAEEKKSSKLMEMMKNG